MDARSFPTHPVDEPVQNLDQARAVMASLKSWTVIGFRQLRERGSGAYRQEQPSKWEKDRLDIIPGLARADQNGQDIQELIRIRHAQAVALVIEKEKARWKQFPELGLSALSALKGFTVSYHNNGPDDVPTMSFHSPVFSVPSMQDPGVGDPGQQRQAQEQAFSRLREAWNPDLPESPLHGILLVLANQDPQFWKADISSPQDTFESLLGPGLAADYAAMQMEKDLPSPAEDPALGTPRFRL